MDSEGLLNRRNALAAAGGMAALALSTGAVNGQEQPEEKPQAAKESADGSDKSAQLTDSPAGWGEPGDKSFRVTARGQRFAGPFSSNCSEKRREIENRFDVVRFGSCDHPTPIDADVVAAEKMAEVIADGGVFNTEFGHRTVKHQNGSISYHTYLSYAGGDRSP